MEGDPVAKTAILKVRIISDGSEAGKGFGQAGKGLDNFEKKVGKASKVAAVAGGAVLGLGAKAISAASDLEQASGAVESIFKGQSAAVDELGRNASRAVGLSNSAYSQTAAVLGAQLQNLGVSQNELVGTTDNLISLGADLAATFGGTTQDAVNALSAAFRGERDPIEKYGVTIKQTQVNAWLAANGLSGLEGQAKTTAEAQATLALITEQTADAHGQFAREAGTVAHQQQVAKASYEDSAAAIGKGLLPVMAALAGSLAGVAGWVGQHPTLFATAAIAILAVVGAILGLNLALKAYRATMLVIGGLTAIWRGLQAAALAYATGTAAANGSSAAVVLGAWIGTHARMAALWITAKVQAIASFVATSASAALHATLTAAHWVAAHARMAAGWVLMRIQAIGTFLAVSGAAALHAGIMAAQWVAANARAAASFLITRGVMLASAAATGIMTAAQWAWNVAMTANPIGLIIVAVVALVAGFVLLWNKSETFRNAVTAVGAAGIAAFNMVKSGVMTAVGAIVTLWNKTEGLRGIIGSAMGAALSPIRAVKSAFDAVASAVSAVIGWISRIRFPSPPSWLKFASGAALTPMNIMTAAATSNVSAFSVPRIDPGSISFTGGDGGGTVVNNTFQISGALDPIAVADQIRGILKDTDRARGSRPAGSMKRTAGAYAL